MANQAVYGIVKSRAQAEKIIQALLDKKVLRDDVSFLSSQGEEWSEFSEMPTEANRNWRTEERRTDFPADMKTEERKRSAGKGGLGHEKHTKAPEGATTGATTGGIIGGTLGLLAGIGALAIPGMGPFIAAGPIMAALSGLGAGGALGGIIGALVGAGIPEYEAKRYENRLKEGGILIAVRANSDSFAKQVKEVMEKNGAEDVSISSEASVSKDYNK
jgi:hypothetical protein